MKWIVTALVVSVCVFTVRADDLVTRDGTVYRNYRVVSTDPGYMMILYNDGGARIPLSNLPDDLQGRYHYDPAAAAAYIKQFAAEDRQQRAAVQAAQETSLGQGLPSNSAASALPAPTPAPDADAPNEPAPSLAADEPPATPSGAPEPDTVSAPSKDFDPGDDPLAPDAPMAGDDSNNYGVGSSGDSYSYSAGYDNSGYLWISSYDQFDRPHWHLWDRRFDDRHGDARRLAGNRDLPEGALVTRDIAGRWVVTYVDDHGHPQRFYRSGTDFHPGEGDAWRVVVNHDGTRSVRNVSEVHQVPRQFDHFAFADHYRSNWSGGYPGYAGVPYPGGFSYTYGGVAAAGNNVHPGSISTPGTGSFGLSPGSGSSSGYRGVSAAPSAGAATTTTAAPTASLHH